MGNSLNLSLPPKQEMTFSYNIPKEDRISSLPDDVILLILPFLPLKEMVKTSILSKRWQNLWVHTPLLDFHGPISYDIVDFDGPISFGRQIDDMERLFFAEWVDRVLRRHDGRYLKEFKIVCWLNGHMQNRIDNWLEFALSRKVQHLKVDLSDSGLYPINMGYNYVFPDRFLEFDLKCLKSLSFTMVEVTGEAFNCFLLNCPFLERLEVVGSAEFAGLDISHPNLALKYLKIKWCRNLKVLSASNFNLVSLDISSVGYLTLTDLPMLVKLSISEYGWTPSHSLSQAPSCYSQLESLTLLGLELKEEVIQLSYLGQMTKLKRLVIKVSASGDESLTILASIIISCPCLEEFVSMVLWSGSELTRRTIREVERGSSSLKSKSLKVFEFMGYRDCVSDVELIMHVVENAICLEKIIIDPRRPIYLTSHRYSKSAGEQEARRLAKKQLKALRKSESIPPHVEVVIR